MKNHISLVAILATLIAAVLLATCFLRHGALSEAELVQDEPLAAEESATTAPTLATPALVPETAPALLPKGDSPLRGTEMTDAAQTEGGSEAVPRQALVSRWAQVPFEQVLAHVQTVTEGPMWAAHDLEHWLLAHPEDGPDLVLKSL